jgi:hypothetical protein
MRTSTIFFFAALELLRPGKLSGQTTLLQTPSASTTCFFNDTGTSRTPPSPLPLLGISGREGTISFSMALMNPSRRLSTAALRIFAFGLTAAATPPPRTFLIFGVPDLTPFDLILSPRHVTLLSCSALKFVTEPIVFAAVE